MLLQSLEIQGFKSFADKTKLTFGKGITAVVGPNGSGKSNISDAVRWVLGEQSSKSLRGAKMEDVIFNGTQSRKAQGFAQVTLTIDNRDNRLVDQPDEVTVTRKYYRSGESDFLLNGASVRLKDVRELFMDTGLGRDGYSMIGQGRIADIVGSKSEDRREIFEEAAGISKFRYRKTEAERKLNQAEENLLRLRDILTELEARVGPLEEQSKQAQRFLELAGEKKTLEIGLWLHTLEGSKDALRDQEHKLSIAKNQLAEAEEQLTNLEQSGENLIEQNRALAVRQEETRQQIALLEEQAAKLESDAAVAQNDQYHNNENITRIQNEIAGWDITQTALNEEIAQKEKEIQTITQLIIKKREGLEACAVQLKNLSEQNENFTGILGEINQKLADRTQESANLRVESSAAQSTVQEIDGNIRRLMDQSEEQQQTLQRLDEEGALCKQDLQDTGTKIQQLENTVKGYEYKQNTKKEKLEALKQKADQLLLDAEEKKRRARILEDLERNLEGFAGSVKAIIQQAQGGVLRGILGPVSRLIQVSEPYTTAIETALGNAGQHIITETEKDAKDAIASLKRQNGGRATFLPLPSIKGNSLTEKGLENCDGYIGVAADLATCESRYQQILQNLLGRIVVTEDLDCATAMAKQYGHRFKIVTLDGQVVNPGGSLTGGSVGKNAGLLGRAAEIEKMKKQAAALEKDASAAAQDYKTAYEEASALDAQITGAKGELATANEDRVRLEGEHKRLSETLAAAKQSILDRTQLLADLNRRKAEQEQIEKQSQERQAIIGAQIEQLKENLEEHTGARDSLQQQRETLSEQTADINLEILALQKDIEAGTQSITEIQQRKSGHSGQVEQLQQQITQLETKNEEIQTNMEQLAQTAAQKKAEIEQCNIQIAEIKQKRLEIEQLAAGKRQEERQKQVERENIGKEVARLEERRQGVQREYDEIIGRLWEDYELTRREAEEIASPVENAREAQRRLTEIKNKIKGLGNVNVGAIEEYKEVFERYTFMKEQVEDVETAKEELFKLIGELTLQMRQQFSEHFIKINEQFGRIFADLFGGGTAQLTLTDPEDVLASGIEINVQPPGKIIVNLDALSGGEKAFVAIAIYFAILKVSPSPFCVLDEIEAALDEVNVDRYAAYLRKMNNRTQFIAITHRRGTMEEADVLYGVTMQDEGISKLLELNASEAAKRLGV